MATRDAKRGSASKSTKSAKKGGGRKVAKAGRSRGAGAVAKRTGGSARGRASKSGARKSGGARKRTGRVNAISILKDDHDRVKQMFDRFERSRSDDVKRGVADKICDELTLHAQVEEEIFYPAVREAIRDDDLMNEALVEHDVAKQLIAEIRGGGEQWDAKVKVLGEYVRHHVKEEEGQMFPKARKADVDLAALGEQIEERKKAGPREQPSRSAKTGTRTPRKRAAKSAQAEQGSAEPVVSEAGIGEEQVRSDQRGPEGRGERKEGEGGEGEQGEGGLMETVRSMLPGR